MCRCECESQHERLSTQIRQKLHPKQRQRKRLLIYYEPYKDDNSPLQSTYINPHRQHGATYCWLLKHPA